jgi:hypothetical protein
MSENKIKYTIMFTYTDTGEVYDVDAELTEFEAERVKRFFGKLLEESFIRPVDETDPKEIAYIVYETPLRVLALFKDIQVGIAYGTGLSSYARDLGVTL